MNIFTFYSWSLTFFICNFFSWCFTLDCVEGCFLNSKLVYLLFSSDVRRMYVMLCYVDMKIRSRDGKFEGASSGLVKSVCQIPSGTYSWNFYFSTPYYVVVNEDAADFGYRYKYIPWIGEGAAWCKFYVSPRLRRTSYLAFQTEILHVLNFMSCLRSKRGANRNFP